MIPWHPWSVLRMLGQPYLLIASCEIFNQKLTLKKFEPSQDKNYRRDVTLARNSTIEKYRNGILDQL